MLMKKKKLPNKRGELIVLLHMYLERNQPSFVKVGVHRVKEFKWLKKIKESGQMQKKKLKEAFYCLTT